MKKFVCSVCGYVYEGEAAPEFCPLCKAPASKFIEQTEEKTWAAEHVVGVASDVPEDIKADLRANFEGECSEVGMYLAMGRADEQVLGSGQIILSTFFHVRIVMRMVMLWICNDLSNELRNEL